MAVPAAQGDPEGLSVFKEIITFFPESLSEGV